ncbi:hypothetical protein KNP414_01961 [Paenibacillus mucilaginosus KNP414]|uniref:Uncharacterized protein n=1 Tax=Paenibacillus mucilaginosus (strain KNP414) TaxID=1036673 RepID=F8FRG5_PAEMK|nr:hypothetical protein KNP414_01961 [Paenibacillus mucilaginosus KNP414]
MENNLLQDNHYSHKTAGSTLLCRPMVILCFIGITVSRFGA